LRGYFGAPENGQLPAPLVPDDLPRGAAYQQLVGRITSNEIIRGKLLSNDGKLTLIVLALDPDAVQSDRLSRTEYNQQLAARISGRRAAQDRSHQEPFQAEKAAIHGKMTKHGYFAEIASR
jgi:hypothetical protein